MIRSELVASIDAGEAIGIRASPLIRSEQSLSFKLARAFISTSHRGITVACAVLSAEGNWTRGVTKSAEDCRPLQRKSPFFPNEAVLNSSVFPMSSKPKPREAELNFEGAMDRLEKIVEQMESGKLPLEDLIVRYEEGMKLVKTCQERLANAEQKIEIITRNSAGKAVVKEFEPAQELGPPEKTAVESESTDDEIKLF
jgi:exodeoxyribonuclease VII small subunit